MSNTPRQLVRAMLDIATTNGRHIVEVTEEVLRAVLMSEVDEDFAAMSDADFEELLQSMREARQIVRALAAKEPKP